MSAKSSISMRASMPGRCKIPLKAPLGLKQPCSVLHIPAFGSCHGSLMQQAHAQRGRPVVCKATADVASNPPRKSSQLLIYCPQHPLVGHWLAVCRNKISPPPIFRQAIAELGRILIYEASQDWLPTLKGQIDTPLGTAECRFIDPQKPVKVIPILRAGLVLLEQAATVLPSAMTYHVGYVRDEKTLKAKQYLNKLPERFAPDDRILICDPMIATGGTLSLVLKDLVSRGASLEWIKVVAVVIAPPAADLLSKSFPSIKVYTAMIDEQLNEQGFIVPGLGDAGDRAFGT